MSSITKYYKGYLKAQFTTVSKQKIGSVNDSQSKIILEPRFYCMNFIEVKEQTKFSTHGVYVTFTKKQRSSGGYKWKYKE